MRFCLALSILLTLASCSTKPQETKTAAKSADPAPCSALPATGLCQDRARALLAFDKGERPAPPKGCEWVVSELAVVDDYLLYLSAKCANGKVMTLDYAGGAHQATLSYATSAVNGDAVKGRKLVSIFGADEKDPHKALLANAREAIKKPGEAAKCRVRLANSKGWPADALVVDVSEAEAAKAPQEGPRSACGPYGLDEDSQTYWRVFQGFSWFFELGQEEPEFDPGSFTLIHKDEKGVWTRSN